MVALPLIHPGSTVPLRVPTGGLPRAVGCARVLVAEDDADLLRLTTRVLEAAGYEVSAAADGDQALTMARETNPDVIVLDVSMPARDGFAVCRALQAESTWAAPVIFLSAHGDTQFRVTGLEAGAVDYIVKPFVPAELRARVQAALRTKTSRDALIAQASTDALTGLANRRCLEARAAEAVAMAQRHGTELACLLVDVDHFKRVNDTFGHPAGDAVLREVGHRIRASVRETDTAARYGGEEFVVLLPETDAVGALAAGEKLRGAIGGRAISLGPAGSNRAIEVHASIGAAVWAPHLPDAAALFDAADRALYEAKERGRDRVVLAAQPPRRRRSMPSAA